MHERKATSHPPYPSLSRQRKQTLQLFYLLPFCFFLVGGGLVGCADSGSLGMGGLHISNPGINVTKISDIQQNPTANAMIYLQGKVTNQAPFLAAGAYKLDDTTGTIWVVTTQAIPNVGDEVLLKGQLQFHSIPIGGQELGEVYIQELEQVQRKAGQPETSLLPEDS